MKKDFTTILNFNITNKDEIREELLEMNFGGLHLIVDDVKVKGELDLTKLYIDENGFVYIPTDLEDDTLDFYKVSGDLWLEEGSEFLDSVSLCVVDVNTRVFDLNGM